VGRGVAWRLDVGGGGLHGAFAWCMYMGLHAAASHADCMLACAAAAAAAAARCQQLLLKAASVPRSGRTPPRTGIKGIGRAAPAAAPLHAAHALHGQRQAPLLGVHGQHLDVHLGADLDHIGHVLDVAVLLGGVCVCVFVCVCVCVCVLVGWSRVGGVRE